MCILLNLLHPVFQCIQTLQNPVETGLRMICIRRFIQPLKYLPCFTDQNMRPLCIHQLLRPLRINDNDIHNIINVFFQIHIICICHGDIFHNRIIPFGKPADETQKIDRHDHERNQADQHQHMEFFLQSGSFFQHALLSCACDRYSRGVHSCVFLNR